MSTNWYEIWADEGHDVPYLLLLRPTNSGYEILDPLEGNRQVFRGNRYEDAQTWLLEDEFVSVGRKEVDEAHLTRVRRQLIAVSTSRAAVRGGRENVEQKDQKIRSMRMGRSR